MEKTEHVPTVQEIVEQRKGLLSMLVLCLSKTTDETLESTTVEEITKGFFEEQYGKDDKQFELKG